MLSADNRSDDNFAFLASTDMGREQSVGGAGRKSGARERSGERTFQKRLSGIERSVVRGREAAELRAGEITRSKSAHT